MVSDRVDGFGFVGPAVEQREVEGGGWGVREFKAAIGDHDDN